MPINFIPNDPLAIAALPMRTQRPRPDRPAGSVGYDFQFNGPVPVREALHPQGTPEFLFWQCREAALLALETWESLAGPLPQWAASVANRQILPVVSNAGVLLNAEYDFESLRFYEHTAADGKTTFSGASTDVVAHEAGHALLDAIRPQLLFANMVEPGAFHEALGDALALLTALSDQATRRALLTVSPDLGTANFVETVLEDLADGVRRFLGASHPSSEPRHALNTFQWQLPETLPTSGPPSVLAGNEHSFSRVFTGCFYDTIRNIFQGFPQRTEATLRTAADTAGRLLIAAAHKAPIVPRFFQAVGRAMILEDQVTNGGANHQAIRNAFSGHGIQLGSAAMTAPRAVLAGRAPRIAAATLPVVSPATRKDLRTRMGATGGRMMVEALELGGEQLVQAVHFREVSLTGLSEALAGVVATAPEPVLIGSMGARAALRSALPEPTTTTDEVRAYVRTLLETNRIDLPGPGRRRRRVAIASPVERPTHAIRTRGHKKELVRIRFVCPGHQSG